MPCNSNYLNPSDRERELQRTAKLYVYLLEKTGQPRSAIAERCAGDIYCGVDFVPALCQEIRGLADDQRDALLYNGRDPKARALADWWEAHEAADKARESIENNAVAQRQVLLSALDKLTPVEKQAVINWAGRELP